MVWGKRRSLGIPNWPQLWRGDPVIGKLQYLTFPDSCPVWKRLVWSRDIWSEFNKPLQASWKYLCSFVQIRLQIPCTSIMITCQRLYSKLPHEQYHDRPLLIPWPVIMHPKADPKTNAILDTMTVFCLLLKRLSKSFLDQNCIYHLRYQTIKWSNGKCNV